MKFITTSAFSAAIATALATLAAPAFAANDNADFARGRLLVEARAGLTATEFETMLKPHGGKRRKLGQSNLHVVDLPANANEQAVLAQLKKHPGVKYAELDKRVKVAMAVNDPYLGSEWHQSKINAPAAWDSTQGAGVIIAILDSGVNGAHPDLAPNLVAGYNIYGNNTDTSDVCGHGTPVAGSAAAATNNGAGVAGVAGQAKIMPVRIAYLDAASNSCYAYYSTIASGITWAADHGARIANVSFDGAAGSSAIQSAAQYMKNKGGLVFIAAGNNNRDEGFAASTSLIAVSATDSSDARSSFSSYGNFVSLAAPGSYIYTTNNSLGYSAWNGTSFASPIAAGVGALMMAANPALDSSKIESLLFSSAADLGAAGRDPIFGYGRVDAAAAVQAAKNYAPPADTVAPSVSLAAPLANSTVSGTVAVNTSSSDNVGVTRVDLKVNGTVVATDTAGPFSFAWDSNGAANGMAQLVAVAYDAAGNVASSTPISVNVANGVPAPVKDTTPPTVAIANPTSGAVSGTVNVSISAADNNGAAGISLTLYIDGAKKASGTGSSLGYSWNTRKESSGAHTIQVVAKDAAGNTTSSSVQVTR
ncbi:S8 family serine peptidase [Massilia sp. BJB1822]|uniref:S8 family serine peptidase n=1 Tax=Massilia sp. BJB1822 TaxID=2744470 RepID=UPI001593793E|nr:S8 family serine peptidase [Massilia sp. BJB1822]NVD98077.1 S8 family serine peptidase [Massilia sp. BJB1822]